MAIVEDASSEYGGNKTDWIREMLTTYLPHHPGDQGLPLVQLELPEGRECGRLADRELGAGPAGVPQGDPERPLRPRAGLAAGADQSAAAARRERRRGPGRRPLARGGNGRRPRRRRPARTGPPRSSGARAAAASSRSSRGRSRLTARRGAIRQLSASGAGRAGAAGRGAPDGTAVVAWSRSDGTNFRRPGAADRRRRDAGGSDPEPLGDRAGRGGAAGRRRPRRHRDRRLEALRRRPLPGPGAPDHCRRDAPAEAAQRLSEAGQDAVEPEVAVGRRRHRDGRLEPLRRLRLDRPGAAGRAGRGAEATTLSLSAGGESAIQPQVALAPGGAATVVWNRFDGSNWIVQGRRLAADGALGGRRHRPLGHRPQRRRAAARGRRPTAGRRSSGTASTAANFVVQARRDRFGRRPRGGTVEPLGHRARRRPNRRSRSPRRQRRRSSGAASTAPTGSSSGATSLATGTLGRDQTLSGAGRRAGDPALAWGAAGPWR